MTILVTGALGYIGSHVARELAERSIPFVGIDNLHRGIMSNSSGPVFIEDIKNKEMVDKIFEDHDIDVVIHLAALTSVPESMEKKTEYIETNVDGTHNLLEAMKKHNCNKIIFSSTASVYESSSKPLKETDVVKCLNNYALTKLWAETLIKKNPELNYVIFRYFNVVGYADWYDTVKEFEKTNIVPAFLQALAQKSVFNVYGNTYPVTRENPKDHSCVRDYIDVRDIAKAHLLALDYLEKHETCHELFNLGTKNGTSVLELIEAFCSANNVTLEYEIKDKRAGDPASVVADSTKANELLGWTPDYTIEQSLRIANL